MWHFLTDILHTIWLGFIATFLMIGACTIFNPYFWGGEFRAWLKRRERDYKD